MFVCLAVAIIAGMTIFVREPALVLLFIISWMGFLFFRHRVRDDEDSKSRPPSHRPRNGVRQAKVPSQYD